MARRESKQRREHRRRRIASTFTNVFLLLLVALAAAGWYARGDLHDSSNILATLSDKPSTREPRIPLPEHADHSRRPYDVATEPSLRQIIQASQKIDGVNTASIIEPKTLEVPGPIVFKTEVHPINLKPQPKLPPVSKFNATNGAREVFAIKRAVVYQQANTTAKPITVVNRGQIMRSYDIADGWHRIVIPSTNVIGWVRGDALKPSGVTKAP